MKSLTVLALAGLVVIIVSLSVVVAYPQGCYECSKDEGYPREPCCDCPQCRHNFEVQSPKDPGCKKKYNHHFDVEKITGCAKESYERLDAAVEVLPDPGCEKSYNYHYGVEKPCGCDKESYETLDFEVIKPKKLKKCKSVKLQAHADHPVRVCQCDCKKRRYVQRETQQNNSGSSILEDVPSFDFDDSDRNRIPRLKRNVEPGSVQAPFKFFLKQPQLLRNRILRSRNSYILRVANDPRSKRKGEEVPLLFSKDGFHCHCYPSNGAVPAPDSEIVGASRSPNRGQEVPVHIGDVGRPVTYEQIKQHLDALPRSEYSPTTNDIIGNLTILFYDIYQQKHKTNFTLPLKYGTRTVIDEGDGLHRYDIKPIEGVYEPSTINKIASKGLRIAGRKLDRKVGQNGARSNRVRSRSAGTG
ncbi:hypothetical protein AND_007558 [Anopheles darlingi]|uniref:Secreted protein n=1 Tax=Anopheles darlingi TaxID=43151 RepID=W5JBP0_ANODA|nr:hypothetical protein AND_007558 [Anopheles darlingi]